MEKLYNRTNWVDNSEPDIDAEHLNNIENGIDNLDLRVIELKMLGWTPPSDLLIKNEIEHLADGDYFVQKVTRDKRFGKEYIYYELSQPIRTKISGNEAVQKINEDMSLIQSEVSFATINDCEIGYAWTGESGYPKRATAFINVKPNTEYSYKIGLSSYTNDVSIYEKTSRTSTTKITEKLITEDGTYSITTSDTTKVLVIEFNSSLELNEYYLIKNFLGLYVPDMLRDMNESILGINSNLNDLAYGEHGGKNLFDEKYENISNDVSGTYKHIYVGDGTFTMSTTAPLTSGNAILFLLSGKVTSGISTSVNGVSIGIPRTVQSSDGYVTVVYRIYGNTSPLNYKTLLEKGNQVTEYTPFINSVKQINESLGAQGLLNKFDGQLEQGYRDVNSGELKSLTYAICSKNPISCVAGKTVSVKGEKQFNYVDFLFYNNGTFVSGIGGNKNGIATVPSGANQYRFNYVMTNTTPITPSTSGKISAYSSNEIDNLKADLSEFRPYSVHKTSGNSKSITLNIDPSTTLSEIMFFGRAGYQPTKFCYGYINLDSNNAMSIKCLGDETITAERTNNTINITTTNTYASLTFISAHKIS